MGQHKNPTDRAAPRERLSRRVIAEIRALLASGELAPGDRLPAERELADRFGVSRGALREAVRELETLGLVQARQGAGTYVRAVDSRELMAPFRMVVALSSAAADDIVAFRRMFEPEVAAMAAVNAGDEERSLLQQALRRYDSALGDPDAVGADVDFHEAVARCSGNALVIAVHHGLAELFSEFRAHLVDATYERDSVVARGHQAVFGAIVAGDADAAREAMAHHLEHVEASLPRGEDIRP